jgi:hypothetical protein
MNHTDNHETSPRFPTDFADQARAFIEAADYFERRAGESPGRAASFECQTSLVESEPAD